MTHRYATLHWLDRAAVMLSGFCVVHCVATVVLLGTLSSLGHLFADPRIHEVGLLLATVLGLRRPRAALLRQQRLRHRRALPLLLGVPGIALMIAALCVHHGLGEAMLTIAGVGLVASAHIANARIACPPAQPFHP